MIESRVVLDSVSPAGHRLTTFKNRNPKFIHGEFMTHRVFSRNAGSSRAIPVAKMIEEVRSDTERAAPIFWGRNQKGMQAIEELDNIPSSSGRYAGDLQYAQDLWRKAAHQAADAAEEMDRLGLHKQVVNRILEPFLHIPVVATATELDNFFGLRLHKAAQPEMRALAIAMWEAREASVPVILKPGWWHLPFVGHVEPLTDGCALFPAGEDRATGRWVTDRLMISDLIQVSVARCARVSYESFETGKRSTVEEDLKLYDRLTAGLRDPDEPLHASPMEHQATPDNQYTFEGRIRWEHGNQHGNLVGWRQYRKMLPGEAAAPLPKEYR